MLGRGDGGGPERRSVDVEKEDMQMIVVTEEDAGDRGDMTADCSLSELLKEISTLTNQVLIAISVKSTCKATKKVKRPHL